MIFEHIIGTKQCQRVEKIDIKPLIKTGNKKEQLFNEGHYWLTIQCESPHQPRLASSASDVPPRGQTHTTCTWLVDHCTWYYSTRCETTLTTSAGVDKEKRNEKLVSSVFCII